MSGEEGEGDSEDDEAVMDFDVVKNYAKPIVRKKKVDMNFSKRVEMEVDESRLSRVSETAKASVRKNRENELRLKPGLAD